MEQPAAQPRVSRGIVFGAVGVGIALIAAIALAVVGVVRTSNLSTKVDRLSSETADIKQTNARLEAKISEEGGTSGQEVGALRDSIGKLEARAGRLEARVKLYDQCVPEIMTQISSLSGNVTGTGPLYVYPSQSVSRYCQPVLYGPTGASAAAHRRK